MKAMPETVKVFSSASRRKRSKPSSSAAGPASAPQRPATKSRASELLLQQQALSRLGQSLVIARPQTQRIARRLDTLALRLETATRQTIDAHRTDLARLSASLTHLNPQAILERGYSIVTDAQGSIIRDSDALEPNTRIAVCFHHGRAEAIVISTDSAEQ